MNTGMLQAFKFEKDALLLLDQTKLPFVEEWLELKDVDSIIEAIKSLRVRGAPSIGICGAYALYIAVYNDKRLLDNKELLRMVADRIKYCRPTAVNLVWGVNKAIDFLERHREADELFNFIQTLYLNEVNINDKLATYGAQALPEGNILTHCNTGSLAAPGVGTALGVIRKMFEMGKLNTVFVSETRPLLQGARLTVFELERDNIPYRLVVDGASGMLMRSAMVDAVIVGADRIAANGDTANKIGTLMHAAAAHFHGVPFFVAAPTSTIDFSMCSGNEIVIEERDRLEVLMCPKGSLINKETTNSLNFAFDVTPSDLIEAIITEKGVFKPSELLTLLN